jgi:tRNA dimethylallyltransferase
MAVALVGPTASGKSDIALAVARARPGVVELVSVDSMAVYRGMDLGTAKPSTAVRAEVAEGLTAELDDLGPEGSGERLAGCAGLLARLEGLDPVAAGRIEPGNERRLVRALEVTLGSGQPFSSFGPGLERYPTSRTVLLGLQRDPEESDRRIAERFVRLMDEGFLDEVRGLAALPGGMSRTARQALGYRELLAHLEEGVPLETAVDEAVRRTRAFAKRQRAWFRRDPRIEWLDPDGDPVAAVLDHLGWDTTESDGWDTTGSDR